jgi:hypothetical protein
VTYLRINGVPSGAWPSRAAINDLGKGDALVLRVEGTAGYATGVGDR